MKNTEKIPDDLLETSDIAELCHVTRRTVYQWIKDNKIKGKRAGRKWLFERSDVMNLLR